MNDVRNVCELLLTLWLTAQISVAASPTLSYSTFLGGREPDSVSAIAVSKDGSLYVGGWTSSRNFPVQNAASPSCQIGSLGSCNDAFLLRLAPDGQSLIFSTYLNLSGTGEDEILDLELDSEGNVYVAGMTASNTGFVGKFTAQGVQVYLIRIDGYPITIARGVAVDSQGNAYVTGLTLSDRFQVTNALKPLIGAPSCTPVGGPAFPQDAFVMKLSPTGNVIYSTFLGGDGNDEGTDIATDAEGSAYVVGSTSSQNFPTASALQGQYMGGHPTGPGMCDGGDFFLTKIDPTGQHLVYSTYLGGTGADQAAGVVVDSQSQAVVYGSTSSPDLPRKGEWPVTVGGTFVAKFAKNGSELRHAGYLWAGVRDLKIDDRGVIFATGSARSSEIPMVEPVGGFVGGTCGPTVCEDAFVVAFDASLGRIQFSTYLGGPGTDQGQAIALDGSGGIFIGGSSSGSGFPLAAPFQSANAGFYDGFLAKISGVQPVLSAFTLVSSASFAGTGKMAPGSIASGFGNGLSGQTISAANLPLPMELEGVHVKITDTTSVDHEAPLFFVSPAQINFLVPAAVAEGPARVVVYRGTQPVAEGQTNVLKVEPGLYSANASGAGVAAAVATHVRPGGVQSHELVFDEGAPVGQRSAVPLAWGSDSEQLILLLFGTGIRGRSSVTSVRVEIGGQTAEVLYAGEQPTFPGLDQVNVSVPRSLAGRGEVPVALSVDGLAPNIVTVKFK